MTAADSLRRSLKSRPLRFLITGGLNALFGFTVYAVAIGVGSTVGIALAVSLIAGVTFNFLTTGSIVFKRLRARDFIPFVLCYGLVYLVNLALLTLVRRAVPSPILAQLVVVLPIAALSYGLLSTFVFDRPR